VCHPSCRHLRPCCDSAWQRGGGGTSPCALHGCISSPPPLVLAFTRDSFVESGIVHYSILLLALDTTFLAPLSISQSILGSTWFPPKPPVLPFSIQYWYWYCQYRVNANPRVALLVRVVILPGNEAGGTSPCALHSFSPPPPRVGLYKRFIC